eukprot:scaffold1253_cov430-Prasinococcus_capsulatus_cf.AAC.7
MEIEALEAILMNDFKKVDGDGPEGLGTAEACYMIVLSPKVTVGLAGACSISTLPISHRIPLCCA